MTLNVGELQTKINFLKSEINEYAQTAQAEINKLQQDLQAKVRDAQRGVDLKQGQLAALEALVKEMNGVDPAFPAFPAPENN